MSLDLQSREYAKQLDQANPLREFKDRFEAPVVPGTRDEILYLVNHSLGRMPKELPHNERFKQLWKEKTVAGHFEDKAGGGWYEYDELFRPHLQNLFDASDPSEVTIRGGDLSTNLGLLLDAFYKPQGDRTKLLALGTDFYSDIELVQSIVRREMLTRERLQAQPLPDDALTLIKPTEGELDIEDEAILSAIEQARDQLALVYIPEVHFLTGRRYDTNRIAQAAHDRGAKMIVDAAHALGNVKMNYAETGVDAAAACTYKYGAAGPGNEAAMYIPKRHHADLAKMPLLRGWFSYHADDRFKTGGDKRLAPGPAGLRLGNTNIASGSVLLDALEIIDEAKIERIEEVAHQLVDYFFSLMADVPADNMQVITPRELEKSGAMLTFAIRGDLVDEIKIAFEEQHVEVDWRDPNIMRISFPPLHNSYEDVWKLCEILKGILLK